jgi:hypothetical protein
MRITENFDSTEFECHCGCRLMKISKEFVFVLQRARDYKKIFYPSDHSIRINCGCRCQEHNDDPDVGGVKNSAHVPNPELGYPLVEAADIDYNNFAELIALVICLAIAGIRRFGISRSKTYLHVDMDHRKQACIWEY